MDIKNGLKGIYYERLVSKKRQKGCLLRKVWNTERKESKKEY